MLRIYAISTKRTVGHNPWERVLEMQCLKPSYGSGAVKIQDYDDQFQGQPIS